MAYSAASYRDQLKSLLPPGEAFTRQRGTDLDKLLDALAVEFSRIDVRGDQLVVEAIPSTTSEMLADWERVAGLPDNCSGLLPETIQARRNALVAKLTSQGGQSIAYFIAVALALGYEITIEEFRPFRAGMAVAGDSITNGDWVFTWLIRAPAVTVSYFLAGTSCAGEPLAYWGNSALECKMNQIKPAHTILIFAYGVEELVLELMVGGPLELMVGGPLELMSA